MNPSANLVLIGPMGCGKSTVGIRLARMLRLEFIDLDREIERRTGVSVAWIFDVEGEAGFRERESELLAEACAGRGRLIATGGGAVLREANRELIARSGFVVYLRLGVDAQLARLARDRKRPLLQAADRRARLEALAAERNPIYESLADLALSSDGRSPQAMAEQLRRRLVGLWQRLDSDAQGPAA